MVLLATGIPQCSHFSFKWAEGQLTLLEIAAVHRDEVIPVLWVVTLVLYQKIAAANNGCSIYYQLQVFLDIYGG